MPRTARKKSEDAVYHVMSRSISEINLFLCDEDKDYYLSLLKKYKEKFHCKIYSYILMDNHVHIYIDPCGADISSFMLSLNTAYVCYFNRKYKRHGHLFQGRFASTIVDNDTYSLTLSAYIHNNAKDIPGYKGKEEFYKYSSYGIFTGYMKDTYEIVDTEYILMMFDSDKKRAQEKYLKFVQSMKDTGIQKEVDKNIMAAYTENVYKSGKCYIIRDKTPDELLQRIGEILGEKLPWRLRAKHCRESKDFRAFSTYVIRVLCGYTYQGLCEYIGNMTVSGISRLSNEGFKLLKEQKRFQRAFNLLIQAN
ncbi:MAG TPA: transposase [Clostridiaceae bacterium]|nr:transposase [Clostridiaceae bacterium]